MLRIESWSINYWMDNSWMEQRSDWTTHGQSIESCSINYWMDNSWMEQRSEGATGQHMDHQSRIINYATSAAAYHHPSKGATIICLEKATIIILKLKERIKYCNFNINE